MEKLNSAFSTTFKHIGRSGWLAWASIAVMALAFLIASIFLFLAYASNLFLVSIEQEPQIYVFFEVGTDEKDITRIQQEWESRETVEYVEYTSEEAAREEFYQAQRDINELAAQAVEDRQLPASLAIRLKSLDYAEEIMGIVKAEKDTNPDIKTILPGTLIVNNVKEIFLWVRVGGSIIMGMLLIVIVLFTLLTVEFRTHSRAEEIEIMQLVGGSLGYIRLPFVIEGSIYGVIGAFISNVILVILAVVISSKISSGEMEYIKQLMVRLSWPDLGIAEIGLIFFSTLLVAALLGAINSFIAIRRYIK